MTSFALDVVAVIACAPVGRLSRTCGWCVAEADRERGGDNKLAVCVRGAGCVTGGSGFPRSRSPIFGRSRSDSVQYCGRRSGSQQS